MHSLNIFWNEFCNESLVNFGVSFEVDLEMNFDVNFGMDSEVNFEVKFGEFWSQL